MLNKKINDKIKEMKRLQRTALMEIEQNRTDEQEMIYNCAYYNGLETSIALLEKRDKNCLDVNIYIEKIRARNNGLGRTKASGLVKR